MDSAFVQLAERTGLAISLTFDPSADPSERWIASLGLDDVAAGPTPDAALANLVRTVDHLVAA